MGQVGERRMSAVMKGAGQVSDGIRPGADPHGRPPAVSEPPIPIPRGRRVSTTWPRARPREYRVYIADSGGTDRFPTEATFAARIRQAR